MDTTHLAFAIDAFTKADGPARKLDRWMSVLFFDEQQLLVDLPKFTEFQDSAVALIRQAYPQARWECGDKPQEGHCSWAKIYLDDETDYVMEAHYTPALALCRALLEMKWREENP